MDSRSAEERLARHLPARARRFVFDHHDQIRDTALVSRPYPVHEAKTKLSAILRRVKRADP